MKNILLIALIYTSQVFAQSPKFQWARINQDSQADGNLGVTTDLAGNIYATGYFSDDSIVLGNTILYNYNFITNPQSNIEDFLIFKASPSGEIIWAKSTGGEWFERGICIKTDLFGNVYVAGFFQGTTLTFGSTVLTNLGFDPDCFLVKYDSSGNVLWAKSYQGLDNDFPSDISVDQNGNIYITGYSKSPDINFGSITLNNLGSRYAIYLAKIDSTGQEQWAYSTGGDFDGRGLGVTNDLSGNLYLTGGFSSPSISFGSSILYGNNVTTYFLVKFDSSGNVIWSTSKNNGTGHAVTTDAENSVYVAGSYQGTLNLGSVSLGISDSLDAFIAKYDSTGQLQWGKSIGGNSFDIALSLATDAHNDVYVSGFFDSDSLRLTNTTYYNAGYSDDFLLKVNSNGDEIWSKALSGIGDDLIYDITCDQNGGVYIAGEYWGTTLLLDTIQLTKVGSNDGFLAKINGGLTNVQDLPTQISTSAFPNPASGKFRINSDDNEFFEIEIYNILGEVVYQNSRITNRSEINVSFLPSGNYIYKLLNNKGTSAGKIVLE